MQIIKTQNTAHPDFIMLIGMLDDHLNYLAGGEENRKQFIPLNSPETLSLILLAYVDGLPAGCAALRVLEDGRGELKRMFVRPENRRQGLAAALLEAVEQAAREEGLEEMVLETGELLAEAVALYKRAGYSGIPPFGPYAALPPSPHSICMAKRL